MVKLLIAFYSFRIINMLRIYKSYQANKDKEQIKLFYSQIYEAENLPTLAKTTPKTPF